MRIELTHAERSRILSIVRSWERDQMSQEVFRDIQRKSGIPARSVEIMFWHTDTLALLAEVDWLVFKGGTCVQSYLPRGCQRASVDLDFNSTIGNPHSIRESIDHLNSNIHERGDHVTIQGFDFGTIDFRNVDSLTGTLNFARRMPSHFGEIERMGDRTIQAKSVRIQINYKHSWLPALRPVLKVPDLFVFEYQQPVRMREISHASREDLIADKILALSMVGPFGRERFKDVYDLGMITTRDFDTATVVEKLELVGRKSNIMTRAFFEGAVETISSFGSRQQEVMGFVSMIGRTGRQIALNWDGFCSTVAERLMNTFQ